MGIIAESFKPKGTNIMLTIDLSDEVLEESILKDVDTIVSYHPPWFNSKKNLTLHSPEGVIIKAIAQGVSIYTPHTVSFYNLGS